MNKMVQPLLKLKTSFSGMYSCHATNKEGTGNSNVVSLIVQCKMNKILYKNTQTDTHTDKNVKKG